ncbi:hypothetical protein BJ165DRAFT_1428472 [Panaeolus papilionaceus]|nr:hypothetical protein BJ165DRAFT_1428472 [Panaeolus papilionaceus]
MWRLRYRFVVFLSVSLNDVELMFMMVPAQISRFLIPSSSLYHIIPSHTRQRPNQKSIVLQSSLCPPILAIYLQHLRPKMRIHPTYIHIITDIPRTHTNNTNTITPILIPSYSFILH